MLRNFLEPNFSSVKKIVFFAVLISVFAVGISLRAYNFSDWLHFETDQVDDYYAVAPAVEDGLAKLPLVGPKAAGTDLRLGPAFYYFQYVSAKVFGNTPAGHAGAALFFSLLSIPLFYFTARQFFTALNSLLLVAVFSTSAFLVLYARFSWNPNVLPFFLLLIISSIMKSVSASEPKKRALWLSMVAASSAIGMQLHVSAMFVIPAFVGCFYLLRRPKYTWKAWILAVGVFGMLYFPTLVYEVVTHGQTVAALSNQIEVPDDDEDASVATKAVQNLRYHSGEYFLILSGQDYINAGRPRGTSLGLSCLSCKEEAPYRLAGYGFFILSLLLLVFLFVREKGRRNFLLLLALWFVFSFLFLSSIMHSGKYLYPRFFLLVAPIPIFFFGFLLKIIAPEKNFWRFCFAVALTAIIIGMNIKLILPVFSQARQALLDSAIVGKEDVFPETGRITLEQQERIADFIRERAEERNLPVYMKSESEYEPSLWLLLEERGIPFTGPAASNDPLYRNGLYVMVYRSASSLTKEMKLFSEKFTLDEEIQFGTLTVRMLSPKEDWISGDRQDERRDSLKKKDALGIPRWEMVGEGIKE